MWRKIQRMLAVVAVTAGVGYSLFAMAGCVLQDAVLFPRNMVGPVLGVPKLQPGVEVWHRELGGGKGEVEAWFAPCSAALQSKRPMVVFAHGNAELIDHQQDLIERYHALGVSVLLVEFRGYGRSGGTPSEKNIVDDFVYFYDKAVTLPGVDADHVVIHGRSLGGGVAAQLAARRPCCALILQSTFRSVPSMGARMFMPWFIFRHTFYTNKVLPSLKVPVLLVHGRSDEVIPVAESRYLHALSPTSELVEFDCGHNDFPGGQGAMFWEALERTLAKAGVEAEAGE
ncbi:MAG: alpha/beta fold hydrolase [Phycisphaera sp.]|nr:alpha/beta fold hydrolase [Phycisphaera sp.]